MIIIGTGKISHDLYMLANNAIPVYLLDGDKPALFDAGLAFLGDIYVQAIKEILGSRTPAYCFLTHSHFDHCGSVSVLMCSEAAGVPDQTGDIISDFLVDYDRYVESMGRLKNLDVEVLCLGHRFAFTGDLQNVIQHVKNLNIVISRAPNNSRRPIP
jgi:glyoxylase-like metal-dependent hydrolase (beta-lactamase superfamily II)